METVRDLEKVVRPEQVVPAFLRVIGDRANEAHIYRGHRKAKWPLRAYLLRDPDNDGEALSPCDAANLEYQLLQGFSKYLFAHRPDLFSASHGGGASEWRKMAIAQHYGVPTRFIDFSTSPLVALYFAVEDDPQNKNRQKFKSAVWAVEAKNRREVGNVGIHITQGVADLPPLDVTFLGLLFDDDKNMKHKLVGKHVTALRTLHEILPEGESDERFKPLSCRLVGQFNKKGKDGKEHDYHSSDLSRLMIDGCVNTAFVPEDMDGRISAQTSVFMYEPSRSREPEYSLQTALQHKPETFQVIIPARLRDRIRVELNDLGINRASLFPNLQGAGEHLEWAVAKQKRLEEIGRLGGKLKEYASPRWKRAHEWK